MKERTSGSSTLESSIFFEALEELNEELKRRGLQLNMICVGGYVRQLLGFEGTKDIDAFYTSTKEIDKIIYDIGERRGINTGTGSRKTIWLNNAVSTMSDWPGAKHVRPLYNFSNMTVSRVTDDYLLGMKLSSTRDIDVEDSADLLDLLGLTNPIDTYHRLEGIGTRHTMMHILTAFKVLYGVEWYSKYLAENHEELLKYLQ